MLRDLVRHTLLRTVTALVVVLAGCSDSSPGGSATTNCDALEAHELPIALTPLLGVGKDESGVLYVADEGDERSNGPRVFVSRSGALYRQRVTGSGSSGGGANADYTLSFEDGTKMPALVIKIRSGKVTGMALSPVGGKAFYDDLDASAQQLEVVTESAIEKLRVHNLPGEVVIEYVARTKAGETLLVTRPKDDGTYEDFRVFYGADKLLTERNVSNVSRAKGGSTVIVFDVDGAEYTADFPVMWSSTSVEPGPATLDTPSGEKALTREEASSETLVGFSYQCFAP